MEVEMETRDGMAQAVKDERDVPWEISYPWGAARFYGSASQVKSKMRKAIVQQEELEAEVHAEHCRRQTEHRNTPGGTKPWLR
jgi:hypothetical protein